MAISMTDVMRHINNFFEVGCIRGMIAISGNAIAPQPDSPYVFIAGSWLHDGVYKVIGPGLLDISGNHVDEEFDGRVWLLKPPPDFLALCKEIIAYDSKAPVGAMESESFGGYSYKRGNATWQDAFSARLNAYRRMFTEVG